MIKHITFIGSIVIFLLLTGCWDQRLLKSHSLILSIGYDLKSDHTLQKTITFPQKTSEEPDQKSPAKQSEVISASGNTVKDTDNKLDQILPKKFDRAKAKVVLLGENLARNTGIFSTLDSMYRDLRGPLSASVAIVEGTAKDALNIKDTHSFPADEYYLDMLNSAEASGIIKTHNVQTICPIILSDTKDVVLPYIKLDQKDDSAKISGLALFSGEKMTGELNIKESIMFLILSDQHSNKIRLNMKVRNDKEKHDKNYVDFAVRKMKRKLDVLTKNDEIKIKIGLSLDIEIDEYAMDHLYDENVAKSLEKKVEKQLNKLAKETIAKMQKFNSDSLGIGQKVKAYHNSVWEKKNWKKVYPEIPIETTFEVDIIRHGILN